MATSAKINKPKKLRTTIYLPEELQWKLKEVAARKRIKSDTLAIEAAINEWVADIVPGELPKEAIEIAEALTQAPTLIREQLRGALSEWRDFKLRAAREDHGKETAAEIQRNRAPRRAHG